MKGCEEQGATAVDMYIGTRDDNSSRLLNMDMPALFRNPRSCHVSGNEVMQIGVLFKFQVATDEGFGKMGKT